MQTTIELDDELFQQAAHYAHVQNPSELITYALQVLIQQQQQKHDIRELRGKIKLNPDYDYKALRSGN
jgi:Arc/MetJ family transcription regulator